VNYHFIVHKEDNGYWSECCELEGCLTQGETMGELYKSSEEALNLYLEEPNNSEIVFPLPDETLDNQKDLIKIMVEPELALAVLLRNYRINANKTQKQVAGMLGMKNIYSYQRLERKSNPTLNIIKKIHNVFPEIQLNYLFQ
jgi:predicted RNase H-like HicB family nuclease/DNA-binding XRE family transcriptional regulator